MTQTFPRQHIAAQISECNQSISRASDLQISLYGLVSMVGETPELKALALQAAEAIDEFRNLARGRIQVLSAMKTVKAPIVEEEEAAV
ncbi:hypothetical protein [Agrobacterium pusense]|uniref:hypothetical protein n=1 Tax=Agrobacterium pusense TaxID=648995 RepID=UPI000D3D001D|nr:hypothetical protein [Agrobacterium pusense]PTV70201.1 hypothetical protein DBL06_25390 [Agrobacterium pusense]